MALLKPARSAPFAIAFALCATACAPAVIGGPFGSARIVPPTPLPIRLAESPPASAVSLVPPSLSAEEAGATTAMLLAATPVGVVLGCGPAFPFCLPIVVARLGDISVQAAQQSRLTPEQLESARSAESRLRAQLTADRVARCLRDTLVARSDGRLVRASDAGAGEIELRLRSLTLIQEPLTRSVSGPDPSASLYIAFEASLRTPQGVEGATQASASFRWFWRSAKHPLSVWAARGGEILEREIETGIGLIARSVLMDVFAPSALAAVLRPEVSSATAEALRARCAQGGAETP